MSRDARVLAARYYAGSCRALPRDLAALSTNPQGVVLFSPRLVALMRPVRSDRPGDWQELALPCPEADAWYVHLLAGDLGLALRLAGLLPPLPLLCFQRGSRSSRIHRCRWDDALRHGFSLTAQSTDKPNTHSMGFSKLFKTSTPSYSVPTVAQQIPVVSSSSEDETTAANQQERANKKGLLSTLLSHKEKQGSSAATASPANSAASNNTTLG